MKGWLLVCHGVWTIQMLWVLSLRGNHRRALPTGLPSIWSIDSRYWDSETCGARFECLVVADAGPVMLHRNVLKSWRILSTIGAVLYPIGTLVRV